MAKKACLLLSLIFCVTTSSCEEQGESTNLEYKVLTPNTWLSGFNDCNDLHNLTMASAEDVRDKNEGYNFTSEISKFLPVWTYAFEVTLSSGTTHLILSNDVSTHVNTFRCVAKNGSIWMQCCESLTNARTLCKERQSTLDFFEVHPQSIGFYAERIYINTTLWVNLRNETEFLQENAQWSVRCLLLDETGNLRTDNCNEHHRTLCIRADTQPILENVAQRRIQPYTGSTTGPPITHSSNNTKSTTVNISTDTGPNKSDISVFTSVVIGVFCVAVVLIVIAVVVKVGYMIKRERTRNHKSNQTRVENAPEQPYYITPISDGLYITPISDEAIDGAYSTAQGFGIGEDNDGYVTPNPKGNVYEPLSDRLDEEHSYGTPAQATGRFNQALEEERVDIKDCETAEKSKELAYDSLEDINTDTCNKETSDQTTNAAGYEWVH